MKLYLVSTRFGVWNSIIIGCTPPKKEKNEAQKEAKKDNSIAMDPIQDGLTGSIKENSGQCILTKEIWDKIKNLYSVEEISVQHKEAIVIKHECQKEESIP